MCQLPFLRLRCFALAGLAALFACGEGGYKSSVDTSESGETILLWDSEGHARAQAIYTRACASCHDPGASDAPSIGVREDWDNRSRMWVAVLAEHVRQGYLEMPPKGGDPVLTDAQAMAATEYIMSVTYPELPLD